MHRLFLSLGVLLVAAPVFLLAGSALSPAAGPLLWLLPLLAALAGAYMARLLPRRGRIPGLLLTMALSACCALPLKAGLLTLVPAALAAGAAALHLWVLTRERGGIPVTFWYAGAALYAAARFIGAITALAALPGPLLTCALLYFVYMLFALTLSSLREGMGGGSAPSRRMTARNLLAAGLLAALLVIGANLPALAKWIRRAGGAILRGIRWLMEKIGSLMAPGGGVSGGGGGGLDLSGLVEEKEPALWLVILEKIAYAVGIAAGASLALFLLYRAARAAIRGIKRLIARLRAYAGAVTEDYEDTVESLLDWGEVRHALRRRERAARAAEEPWDRQTPRQRVRSSYRAFLGRHPDLPAAETARQAVGDARLSDIYEAARYSSREITPEEAERSRELRKK